MHVIRIVGADRRAREDSATALVAALVRRGVGVSVVARCAAEVAFDRPGKDSHAHRAAGARDVAVISGARWAVLHEHEAGAAEPSLAHQLARLAPVDWVIALDHDEGPGEPLRLDSDGTPWWRGRRYGAGGADALAGALTASPA